MTTIYYPHLDLENRGLLRGIDHVLNIKLLTLMADHVLVLSSHLLDADINSIYMIRNGLYSFIEDGTVKTVLYNGYTSLEEYLYYKTEGTVDRAARLERQRKADYISNQIFSGGKNLVHVDNDREREQFHSIYIDTNLSQAQQTRNTWLIHSAREFRDEILIRKEKKAAYLTLPEINQALFYLIDKKRIVKKYYPFFIRNQIGAYYYCGSLANSAVTAFNPYFNEIRFDEISSHTRYHSTGAYDPVFFMKILLSLNIIADPEDIKYLSSRDVRAIRKHKSWEDFQALFSMLYDEALTFNEIVRKQQDIQTRMEWLKGLLFCVPFGVVSEKILSPVAANPSLGKLGVIIGCILSYLLGEHRSVRLIREAIIDRMIERLYTSREPLYVLTNRLKRTVDKIMLR